MRHACPQRKILSIIQISSQKKKARALSGVRIHKMSKLQINSQARGLEEALLSSQKNNEYNTDK